jgi:hypothetical protein
MMARRPDRLSDQSERQDAARRDKDDPPIRPAHVLFVLWVAGSVAWAFFAAKLAHDQEWFVQRPELAAILVLAPPILAHVLANFVIRLTGNPKFYS